MKKEEDDYFFLSVIVNNRVRKLYKDFFRESVLSTLTGEIFSEIKKQNLLVSYIMTYDKEESEDKKEIFYNENDILKIYRELKLINGGVSIFDEAVERALQKIIKYTKHDTEVTRDTLSQNEVIQALNTSISKFIELHYQQPRELKHTLIDYKETAIREYIEVT